MVLENGRKFKWYLFLEHIEFIIFKTSFDVPLNIFNQKSDPNKIAFSFCFFRRIKVRLFLLPNRAAYECFCLKRLFLSTLF